MKFRFAFCSMLFCAVAMVAVAGRLPFAGKSGGNLKNAVAATSRPKILLRDYFAFLNSSEANSGQIIDRFTGESYPTTGLSQFPPGLSPVEIAPSVWWRFERDWYGTYGDTVSRDALNRFVGGRDVASLKGDFPPAILSRTRFDNGVWQVGYLTVDGVETNGWAPPYDMRGDFARTFFYMLTVYPTVVWDAWALLVFDESIYPALSRYGIDLFLEWHRGDPVDNYERRRNDVAERMQGNRNLFVDYPDLAEYLWGRRKGDVYLPDEGGDDPVYNPVALRSHYDITDDRIDLWSPFVADGAIWTVDGRRIEDQFVVPAELGIGRHLFGYDYADEHGEVIVEIVDR